MLVIGASGGSSSGSTVDPRRSSRLATSNSAIGRHACGWLNGLDRQPAIRRDRTRQRRVPQNLSSPLGRLQSGALSVREGAACRASRFPGQQAVTLPDWRADSGGLDDRKIGRRHLQGVNVRALATWSRRLAPVAATTLTCRSRRFTRPFACRHDPHAHKPQFKRWARARDYGHGGSANLTTLNLTMNPGGNVAHNVMLYARHYL